MSTSSQSSSSVSSDVFPRSIALSQGSERRVPALQNQYRRCRLLIGHPRSLNGAIDGRLYM